MIVYTVAITDNNGYKKVYEGTNQKTAAMYVKGILNDIEKLTSVTLEYNAREI